MDPDIIIIELISPNPGGVIDLLAPPPAPIIELVNDNVIQKIYYVSDMMKAVYDINDNGIVDNSERLDGYITTSLPINGGYF